MTATFHGLLSDPRPLVRVEVAETHGSTPRGAGTWMLVSADALAGTIGGGRIEHMAIREARSLLGSGDVSRQFEWPLGPEIGQCCGGHVVIGITRLDHAMRERLLGALEDERTARPAVYIFGAGNVGMAVAEASARLPVRTLLIDSRPDFVTNAPAGVETRTLAMPEALLAEARDDSAIIVTTHEHAQDFLIAGQALEENRFRYVGMIGSKTKRAAFRNQFIRAGGRASRFETLVCPMGMRPGIRDKRPEVIAIFVVSDVFERLCGAEHEMRKK